MLSKIEEEEDEAASPARIYDDKHFLLFL